MDKIKQAKLSLHAISAALEEDYPDNSGVWAHVEEVAEVINGTAPDMLDALIAFTASYEACGEVELAYQIALKAIAKATAAA